MSVSHQVKIQEFDKYIMQGGDQTLPQIEDLCVYGFVMMNTDPDEETFNDVVIDVIKKLRRSLHV